MINNDKVGRLYANFKTKITFAKKYFLPQITRQILIAHLCGVLPLIALDVEEEIKRVIILVSLYYMHTRGVPENECDSLSRARPGQKQPNQSRPSEGERSLEISHGSTWSVVHRNRNSLFTFNTQYGTAIYQRDLHHNKVKIPNDPSKVHSILQWVFPIAWLITQAQNLMSDGCPEENLWQSKVDLNHLQS